jgi:hypothetical protein
MYTDTLVFEQKKIRSPLGDSINVVLVYDMSKKLKREEIEISFSERFSEELDNDK